MNWAIDALDRADQKILDESKLAYKAKCSFEGDPASLKVYYWQPQKIWFAKIVINHSDEPCEAETTIERKYLSHLFQEVFNEFNLRISHDTIYSSDILEYLYHQFDFERSKPEDGKLEQSFFDDKRREIQWCLIQGYIQPFEGKPMYFHLEDAINEMRRLLQQGLSVTFFR